MSWFADLAGKAENLLNNLDEQTGAALRNHNVGKPKKHEFHQEFAAGQKKRPTGRNFKKVSTSTETRATITPSRKPSPTSHQPRSPSKDSQDIVIRTPRSKKSPNRKPNTQFSLNHCPRTLVGDIKDSDVDDQYGLKQRRYSLPADLELLSSHNLTYKMQNLEVENAMLKNELNVMNREVSELLDRLRRTEDELSKTQIKFENSELHNQRITLDRDSQITQIEQLKHKINEITMVEVARQKDHSQALETELSLLKDRNLELEEKIKQLTDKTNENNASQLKLENDLRHAQSTISELKANLEKSNAECQRLEKDWETYKLRVKSMLFAKDNEIKSLQEGMNLTEDTKNLIEQLDGLKEEREVLSDAISRVRGECNDMKTYIDQLESRHSATERVVTALRDALRDERAAKNRAEAQCLAIGKELKTVQIETGQTIASLRTALRDKENELTNLRNTTSSIRTTDTSALNVADYDVMQESIDNDKIHYLTETLVQKQGKIDSLLADNNMLRIQLEKLESKFKAEVMSKRNHTHSVHVEDRDRCRSRHQPVSALSALSVRFSVAMKRHPLFRTFIVIYMICLHLWVLTVLFTSTPDGHIPRHVKS
ncbi:golgin subfamily A member 5 isoform X2 [Ostrinia furnacalis]|uniref:golgin subfamily A member 5 isoform X2 n=1 Tax=Ostrinia furnacalis TaxID=93504 RepID=UPI00103A42C4|nr:golgin subfamily A member 5 isoform X2 [Ostrinia furnacalis]